MNSTPGNGTFDPHSAAGQPVRPEQVGLFPVVAASGAGKHSAEPLIRHSDTSLMSGDAAAERSNAQDQEAIEREVKAPEEPVLHQQAEPSLAEEQAQPAVVTQPGHGRGPGLQPRFWRHLGVGQIIVLGFGLMAMLGAANALLFMTRLSQIRQSEAEAAADSRRAQLAGRLAMLQQREQATVRAFLLEPADHGDRRYGEAATEFAGVLLQLRTAARDSQELARLDALKQAWEQGETEIGKILRLEQAGRRAEVLAEIPESARLSAEIRTQIQDYARQCDEHAAAREEEAERESLSTEHLTGWMILLSALIALGVILSTVTAVGGRMSQVQRELQAIANRDLDRPDIEVHSSDALGRTLVSANRTRNMLHKFIGELEHYRVIVESLTDYAIYSMDREGRIDSWTAGSELMTGRRADQALGKKYVDLIAHDSQERARGQAELDLAACTGSAVTDEWRPRQDGELRWISGVTRALRAPDGSLTGFVRVARDMTRQKRDEERLQEINAELERYKIIVESMEEHVAFSMDRNGIITSWNSVSQRVTGVAAEQILGCSYIALFSPSADCRLLIDELEDAARLGSVETEQWRRRPDGRLRWAVGVTTALHDSAGAVTGFVRVARDMTRQKQNEDRLRQAVAQLDRYRIIVENVRDYVIYTLDNNGIIDNWSPGAEEVTGFAAAQAIGRPYSLVFTEEEKQKGQPEYEMAEAARTGHCDTSQWRMHANGSVYWASGVLTAIRDSAGEIAGYIRVARDATKQKMLEEQQRQLAVELEMRVRERTRELSRAMTELQRKNDEVEAFVYIVSHDLRAPLVNMQGFARELESSCQNLKRTLSGGWVPEGRRQELAAVLDEDIAGALHFIFAASSKFERLIDALLDLSRRGRQVYRMGAIDAVKLLELARASYEIQLEQAGAELDLGALPPLWGDQTALGQVFDNLIGNAIKYRSPERPLRIEIEGREQGDEVLYTVRDNGLGIPESARARLFQVFQRFHPQVARGEGMGLAIAQKIVERHGGRITVESREGEGTAFQIRLPRHGAETIEEVEQEVRQ